MNVILAPFHGDDVKMTITFWNFFGQAVKIEFYAVRINHSIGFQYSNSVKYYKSNTILFKIIPLFRNFLDSFINKSRNIIKKYNSL